MDKSLIPLRPTAAKEASVGDCEELQEAKAYERATLARRTCEDPGHARH